MVSLLSNEVSHQSSQKNSVAGPDRDRMEKDKTEVDLEKLVFGNAKSFRDELRLHENETTAPYADVFEGGQREDQEALSEKSLGGLNDADVSSEKLSYGLLVTETMHSYFSSTLSHLLLAY